MRGEYFWYAKCEEPCAVYEERQGCGCADVLERVLDCLEASLPTFSGKRRRDILHFVTVGGVPTGVELTAEIDELVQGHLLSVYPHLKDLVTISVYDVADQA